MGSPGKFGLLGALSAAIVAAVLFGSACVSVENTTTVSGGAPLVIGHLTISGAYEDSRYHAAALAAAHFNLAGGVNGRPVVIVSRNTDVDPANGIAAVQELVDKYGAVGIVGPRTSVVSVAVVESVAAPRKLLLVSPSATSPALTEVEDDDFFFRTAPSDLVQGVVLANLAKESGYDHVAVIHVNDPYGIGLADQFEETFTGLGGVVTKGLSRAWQAHLQGLSWRGRRKRAPRSLVPISHGTEALNIPG